MFKESRRRVARAKATGDTTSGLNGLSAFAIEEVLLRGDGLNVGEELYEEETRRKFAGWKAKFGKIYRDVREEDCRYRLFKGNRRIVVQLNAAAGEGTYGLNQFGDLANEEVRERCDGSGAEGKLGTRCQAASQSYTYHEILTMSQVIILLVLVSLSLFRWGKKEINCLNFYKWLIVHIYTICIKPGLWILCVWSYNIIMDFV